jgi:hypothetical protein
MGIEERIRLRKQRQAEAESMPEVTHRIIKVKGTDPDGGVNMLSVEFSRHDPDYSALLDHVQTLPGRSWTGKQWLVPVSVAVAEFAKRWDYPVKGKAAKVLKAAAAVPVEDAYDVVLSERFGVAMFRNPHLKLMGSKPLDLDLLDYAREYELRVDPAVEEAILQSTDAMGRRLADLLTHASNCANPAILPVDFMALAMDAVK